MTSLLIAGPLALDDFPDAPGLLGGVGGSAAMAAKRVSANSAEIVTGNTPIFRQLFLKMSAKKLDTTQRKP